MLCRRHFRDQLCGNGISLPCNVTLAGDLPRFLQIELLTKIRRAGLEMAFHLEHHGAWLSARVWYPRCRLFKTHDVLSAPQRTPQRSKLPRHFLRRKRARFAAGMWDWVAGSFRSGVHGDLQLCSVEPAAVERSGQVSARAELPFLHFQFSFWQLWVHHSPALSGLGLFAVHRSRDQSVSPTDWPGNHRFGHLHRGAGNPTTMEGSRHQWCRHCFECGPPDIGGQVSSSGYRDGSRIFRVLHLLHLDVPSPFWKVLFSFYK